ncbi:MAG: TIGR03560 family F420-dependent LLM class oxidoreductase [Anaerolineae bacterium]|nr:TIGR03560 family F420-dependent LLM class oxidoreductase [Anaerolineae bacterium]
MSMDINLMIEAQAGVYWPEWELLARAAEDLGFDGLYRSDHFAHGSPPKEAALELWTSLTYLALRTERVCFGSLVSPAAFRHPAVTAWCALQVDDLSGGRLRLGLGAGWNVEEHQRFGLPLLEIGPRFDRFEEYLQIVMRLFRERELVTFDGDHYQLDRAMLMPRPERPGGPPITVGGNGPQKTLPLAARYADEWNAVWCTRERWTKLNARLEGLLAAEGRASEELRRTMMTGIFYGRTDAELRDVLGRQGEAAEALRGRGALVGTSGMVRDQLGELADMGLDGVMLQWLDIHDFDRLEALAAAVV